MTKNTRPEFHKLKRNVKNAIPAKELAEKMLAEFIAQGKVTKLNPNESSFNIKKFLEEDINKVDIDGIDD